MMMKGASTTNSRTRTRSGDTLLFEIGTEELPATVLADLYESAPVNALGERETMLTSRFKKALEEKRISYEKVFVWATPRRLVFWAHGVGARQIPKQNLIKGPAKQDAYAGDGQPTEKLLGFLKAKKASLKDVVIQPLQGKEYVYLQESQAVQSTTLVLPGVLETLVRTLSFSKNMRWGYRWPDGSELVFPRPIRSFLCLYGQKPIRFKLAGIPVQNDTFIFSKAGRRRWAVRTQEDYFKILSKNGVILDPALRKKAIRTRLEKTARALRNEIYDDVFLLNEVNFLVENPHILSAPFSEEFLKLPLEVLTVSMARKQRIFGLLDKAGRVAPRFLGVLDGRPSARETKLIARNFENILHAKLQDSLFFYREDLKVALAKKREELNTLVFLKGAGSMRDKSDRLVAMAKEIGPVIGFGAEEQASLERAAYLSKSDLLTQMVGEFPELQGIMGKYYALENGENSAAAEAIGEQYLPRAAQGALPKTRSGAVLALLDKIDLVRISFDLGLEPTSSLDPYGLRRSATGVFKILLDQKLRLDLARFFSGSKNLSKLELFFRERLKALFLDRGIREDVADAVMVAGALDAVETSARATALTRLLKEESLMKSWKVVERTTNILKGSREAPMGDIAPDLLRDDLERVLYERYRCSRPAIEEASVQKDWKLVTSLYAEAFFDILDGFFEKVLVNVEDAGVRRNRLTLLKNVRDLYVGGFADISKILKL